MKTYVQELHRADVDILLIVDSKYALPPTGPTGGPLCYNESDFRRQVHAGEKVLKFSEPT